MQAQEGITHSTRVVADSPEQAALRVVQFFEALKPHDVARLKDFYCADALFKDPFNEVHGVDAIAQIFSHMFDALIQPRFVITQKIQQGEHCFVTWDFLFAMHQFQPNTTQTIRGASLRHESFALCWVEIDASRTRSPKSQNNAPLVEFFV